MKPGFSFTIAARHGATNARCGTLVTPHGEVETPTFMPVGTVGSVKSLTVPQVEASGARIVLGNTFHLHLRPGEEVVKQQGGLHRFTGWRGPMLTDSGGFQVFSLARLRTISEEGADFRSPVNGDRKFLSPESSMAIQQALGADIAMAFDEVPALPAGRTEIESALERTARWAERCLKAHASPEQALYGIVQGGVDKELRRRSATQITGLGFDGFAIGGLSVGEPKAELHEYTRFCAPLLPEERPRYLMGVGMPEDLINAIEAGFDQFDCIAPTRMARHGSLFTDAGRISIKRAEFERDDSPVDPACDCFTCKTHSRAYLHHLRSCGELAFFTLATIHNLRHYGRLMERCRAAIRTGASLRALLPSDAKIVD